MNRLVDHVLFLAQREKGKINNLNLNKVLVLSLRDYFRLYTEDALLRSMRVNALEFWPYGLTHRDIYLRFKHLGRCPIPQSGVYHEALATFDPFVLKWLHTDLKEMVHISQDHDVWRKNVSRLQQGESIPVTLGEL